MLSLAVSLVVFVGIGGPGAKKVDKQVGALLQQEADVARIEVSARDQRSLARRDGRARKLVAGLDADGVIAGELVKVGRGRTLHIIVYGGDGGVKDMLDVPLKGTKLGRRDLAMFRSTVIEGAIALNTPPPELVDEPVDEPVASAADEAEDPLGDAEVRRDARPRAAAGARQRPWLRLALGGGVVGRTMDSGLSAVPDYVSSPVGSVRVDAEVRPLRLVALGGEVERTLALDSNLASGPAPTSISRWQGTVAVVLGRGGFELAPTVGYGHRAFVIETAGASPLPDSRFGYVVLGARVRAALGARLAWFGFAAFEPGVSAADATEMAYQPEGRWAVELNSGLELRAMRHVFVRARADYHRFAWTWSAGGVSGAAADRYAGGTLSVGAAY